MLSSYNSHSYLFSPSSIHLSLNTVFFEKSNAIIFSGLGFFFNYSTLSYSHDCFTHPFFLPTNATNSFSLPSFTFNLTSQSSCVTPFSASVQIAVSNSFSPQNEHHFRSPSRGCFCSTILARSSPPLQLRLVQSAPLCESHLQRWEERILYTVSKVWSYCEIKVTGQLQIKYS